jgi:hypothetical protein
MSDSCFLTTLSLFSVGRNLNLYLKGHTVEQLNTCNNLEPDMLIMATYSAGSRLTIGVCGGVCSQFFTTQGSSMTLSLNKIIFSREIKAPSRHFTSSYISFEHLLVVCTEDVAADF